MEGATSPFRSEVVEKMKAIVIPEVNFAPPATLVDAVAFFKQASRTPHDKQGIDFILQLPPCRAYDGEEDSDCIFSVASANGKGYGVPVLPVMNCRDISLYDALKNICDVTGMIIRISGDRVQLMPFEDKDILCGDFFPHSYNVSFDPSQPVTEDDLKALFTHIGGVQWPIGTSICYLSAIGKLRVTNTIENHDILRELLSYMNHQRVHASVQILAFRVGDIEKLQRNGDMTVKALMALRKAGKAKPVATASAVAEPGKGATMKAVQDVISPATPQDSAAREPGMVLEVTPETSWNKPFIDLNVRAQWVTLARWETHTGEQAAGRPRKVRRPVFNEIRFETRARLEDGDTILLGSSTTPDGKWVQAGFLTVRRQDAQPGLLRIDLDRFIQSVPSRMNVPPRVQDEED